MKKIIFLSMLLFSFPTLASESFIIYDTFDSLFKIIKDFSMNIHTGIILIYTKSYFLICSIASPVVLYAYARNRIDFDSLIAYFIFLIISIALVVNKLYFVDIIYNPYMSILKKSIAFIMDHSGNVTYQRMDNLADLFSNIYHSTNNYTARLDKVAELDWSSILTGAVSITQFLVFFFNVIILKMMFSLTSLIFIVKFIMIIFYIHIILVFLPISISLFPFKSLRPYALHNFKLLLQFLLNLVIQTMGIAISLYTLFVLNKFPVENIGSYQDGVGGAFFWASIISSAVGGFTIITSGYLSSLILSAMGLPPSVSSRVGSSIGRSRDYISSARNLSQRGLSVARSTGSRINSSITQSISGNRSPKRTWTGYGYQMKRK